MSILRRTGSNKYFWTFCWTSVATVGFGWMCFRRIGVGSDYPRIQYLATAGDTRTLLEPGSIPDNPFLPPHMRLDMKSYLDPPDCQIAVPPEYDLTTTYRDLTIAMQDILPPEERREFTVGIGPLHSRTMLSQISREERFINRRLGMTQEMKDRSPQEDYGSV